MFRELTKSSGNMGVCWADQHCPQYSVRETVGSKRRAYDALQPGQFTVMKSTESGGGPWKYSYTLKYEFNNKLKNSRPSDKYNFQIPVLVSSQ